MFNGKPFWRSKTFWFNVLALIVMVANAFGFADFQADPEVSQMAFVIVTVVNLVLRFVTKEPVYLKPPKEA